jgi:hypothetical protein
MARHFAAATTSRAIDARHLSIASIAPAAAMARNLMTITLQRRHTMSRYLRFVPAFLLVLPICAAAQDPSPVTKPAANTYSKMKNEVTAKGTIEAIAPDHRVVTVKFDSGYSEVVSVSPQAKRFGELKVGDKVMLKYYESVVLYLRKPGDTSPEPPASDKSAATPGEGKHPGGTAARQVKATVTVVSVDKAVPSITLKTADGYTVTRKVQDAKYLENVAPGDKIDITYTEAMLVTVEPAT